VTCLPTIKSVHDRSTLSNRSDSHRRHTPSPADYPSRPFSVPRKPKRVTRGHRNLARRLALTRAQRSTERLRRKRHFERLRAQWVRQLRSQRGHDSLRRLYEIEVVRVELRSLIPAAIGVVGRGIDLGEQFAPCGRSAGFGEGFDEGPGLGGLDGV
jgi:hypothetical protein